MNTFDPKTQRGDDESWLAAFSQTSMSFDIIESRVPGLASDVSHWAAADIARCGISEGQLKKRLALVDS